MTLPRHPGLAWTLSFWFAAVTLLAAVITLSTALLAPLAWTLPVPIAACAAAVSGLLRPELAERPYHAWNALASRYAAIAREVVVRACYFVVFVGTARAGSRFEAARPPGRRSGWVQKPPPGIETYDRSQRGTVVRWITRYLSWSGRSGNLWAACLLPFVLLLIALDEDEPDGPSARLYTLY